MALMGPTTVDTMADDRAAERKPRRRWRDKFREAFRGLKVGIRGHSSFFVHFFMAAIVIAAAIVLGCDLKEWAILIGCIGAVLTAELFNSAIETLYRGFDVTVRESCRKSLDIAAGAVLMASIAAAAIGTLVLGARVLNVLGW